VRQGGNGKRERGGNQQRSHDFLSHKAWLTGVVDRRG